MGNNSSKSDWGPDPAYDPEGETAFEREMRKRDKGLLRGKTCKEAVEERTGKDFSEMCEQWAKRTGGKWPKDGSFDPAKIRMVRRKIKKREACCGCCRSIKGEEECLEMWENVARQFEIEAERRKNEGIMKKMSEEKAKAAQAQHSLNMLLKEKEDKGKDGASVMRKKKAEDSCIYPPLPSAPPAPPAQEILPPPARQEPPPAYSPAQAARTANLEEDDDDTPPRRSERIQQRRQQPLNEEQRAIAGVPRQFPLVEMPNPRDDGMVQVQRNWDLSELKEVVNSLPDPNQVGGARFWDEVLALDGIYQPSGREWEQVLRRKLKGDWAAVNADFGTNATNTRANPFTADMAALGNRIKEKYKKTPDWNKIQKEKQGSGETVSQWEARLDGLMKDHSGIDNDEARRNAMKTLFVAGLRPKVQQMVKTTCLGWSQAEWEELRRHAIHAEEVTQDQKERQASTLQLAQLQLTQAQLRYHRGGPNNRRGQSPRERGGFNSRDRRQFQRIQPRGDDQEGCFLCGNQDHWRKDCPQNNGQQWPPPQRGEEEEAVKGPRPSGVQTAHNEEARGLRDQEKASSCPSPRHQGRTPR